MLAGAGSLNYNTADAARIFCLRVFGLLGFRALAAKQEPHP
jgi:hypothetical protein